MNASAKMSARMMTPPPTATAMVMIVFLDSAAPVLPERAQQVAPQFEPF